MNSSLDIANKINIQLTEKEFVEISLEAISAAYKPLDRFSMWLLGATGAFIALIVSNTTFFSALKTSGGWFYFEVIALLVSALCGLIAKFFLA